MFLFVEIFHKFKIMPTFEDLSWIGQEIKTNFERHVCIVITRNMYKYIHLHIHIVIDNIE